MFSLNLCCLLTYYSNISTGDGCKCDIISICCVSLLRILGYCGHYKLSRLCLVVREWRIACQDTNVILLGKASSQWINIPQI